MEEVEREGGKVIGLEAEGAQGEEVWDSRGRYNLYKIKINTLEGELQGGSALFWPSISSSVMLTTSWIPCLVRLISEVLKVTVFLGTGFVWSCCAWWFI